MNRWLHFIPVGFVIIALFLGLFGWFAESSTIKWVAPAYGLALISLGLGLHSYLNTKHIHRRMSQMDATLTRIEALQEDIQKEQKEQTSSRSPVVESLQALSQLYFDFIAKQEGEDEKDQ